MTESIIVNFDIPYAAEIRKIRNSVFTSEQKIPEDIDFDGKDTDAVHVLIKMEGRFVGTGRMLQDGHIGRLAVLKDHRGKGAGAKAVKALIDEAFRKGFKRVFLGAQLPASGFYSILGFKEYGSTFIEAGIKHIHMEKIIR